MSQKDLEVSGMLMKKAAIGLSAGKKEEHGYFLII